MTIARHRQLTSDPATHRAADEIAAIYNKAGKDYLAYADGDPARLFSFDGPHGYADQQIWHLLQRELARLRASGKSSIRLLDAGCGPGTWLRRLVVHALELGFTDIKARGFDLAVSQVHQAQALARRLSEASGIHLRFEVADLTERLPEADASVDVALCLYSVLSHIPAERLSDVAREIARVTSGYFVATVRSIGSTPSAFAYPVENIRHLQLRSDRNECELELSDGTRNAFSFRLFSASQLRDCFTPHFLIEEVRGLDVFHTRFSLDRRWNPPELLQDSGVLDELALLEEACATKAAFIDRATHILLGARNGGAQGNPTPSGGLSAGDGCHCRKRCR
jgi:SAM-dependent methyltransferase